MNDETKVALVERALREFDDDPENFGKPLIFRELAEIAVSALSKGTDERGAIVAWLRGETGLGFSQIGKMFADKIELGEHLPSTALPKGTALQVDVEGWPADARHKLGDSVQKKGRASWRGKVVGYYRTDLTALGYAVESMFEPGSVQIYPEIALEALTNPVAPQIDVEAIRAQAFEEAEKVAISHSNYGAAEGNERAYRIASDLEKRAKDIRAALSVPSVSAGESE